MSRKIYNVDVICDGCNITFQRERRVNTWFLKKGRKQYCTKECYYNIVNTSIETNCLKCEKAITKPKRVFIKNNGNCFCSKSCSISFNNSKRIKEKHPNWKGAGYRNLALNNQEVKCHFCDYSIKEVLQVHHKDFDRKNNSLENLIIVCPNHHMEIHKKLLVIE